MTDECDCDICTEARALAEYIYDRLDDGVDLATMAAALRRVTSRCALLAMVVADERTMH